MNGGRVRWMFDRLTKSCKDKRVWNLIWIHVFGNINVLAIRVIAMAIIMASVKRKPESEHPKYVMRNYVLNWLKIGWYINGTNILGKHAPQPNIVILLLLFHYIWRWFHTFITPCILYVYLWVDTIAVALFIESFL